MALRGNAHGAHSRFLALAHRLAVRSPDVSAEIRTRSLQGPGHLGDFALVPVLGGSLDADSSTGWRSLGMVVAGCVLGLLLGEPCPSRRTPPHDLRHQLCVPHHGTPALQDVRREPQRLVVGGAFLGRGLAQLPPRCSWIGAPRRQAIPDRHERTRHPSNGTVSVGAQCSLARFWPDSQAPTSSGQVERRGYRKPRSTASPTS